jgi:cytoskeletal protein CcmA (bactofilin family)
MSQPTHPSDPLTLTSAKSGRSHLTVGAKLTGDLNSPGLMELLGHVDGKVTADSISIEDVGSVVGELWANSVAIKGHFEGTINGGDVRLHAGAKVSGEIFYRTLLIEYGAEVNSSCSSRARNGDNTSGSVGGADQTLDR